MQSVKQVLQQMQSVKLWRDSVACEDTALPAYVLELYRDIAPPHSLRLSCVAKMLAMSLL